MIQLVTVTIHCSSGAARWARTPNASLQAVLEGGGGGLPIFGLFASNFTQPQLELLPRAVSSHSTSCSSMTSILEVLLSQRTFKGT